MIATVTPQELDSRRQAGQTVELIDVRTPAEFQEVHVPFARTLKQGWLSLAGLFMISIPLQIGVPYR